MVLIGTHTSVAGGLDLAFERAEHLGCTSMQIFTRNPRQWNSPPLLDSEIEKFRFNKSKSTIKKIVSHTSYLINLSGSESIREKSEKMLLEEIIRCHKLGISDIVLHPGFAGTFLKPQALEMISKSLLNVFNYSQKNDVRILLETMAGQGSVLGGSISDLYNIIKMTGNSQQLGLCIDTCHIFASGYDIKDKNSYNKYIEIIDRGIGTGKIGCLHINDSKFILGSKKDRHANIGDGQININLFKYFLQDERFNTIPAILETPKENNGDIKNLKIIMSLIKQ
ncbi:MAG: deoxyribonuclease IV [Synergistaceae bacterium]